MRLARSTRPVRLATAIAVACTAILLPAQALAAPCPYAHANPNSVPFQVAKAATLCLLNHERRAHGLPPLRDNRRLDAASQRHARDMARRKYFAHGNFVGRIRHARYLAGTRSWTVGENIAWGSYGFATPAAIVHGWMLSPKHRANILRRGFHEIGVGVALGAPVGGERNAATYATDFGARR